MWQLKGSGNQHHKLPPKIVGLLGTKSKKPQTDKGNNKHHVWCQGAPILLQHLSFLFSTLPSYTPLFSLRFPSSPTSTHYKISFRKSTTKFMCLLLNSKSVSTGPYLSASPGAGDRKARCHALWFCGPLPSKQQDVGRLVKVKGKYILNSFIHASLDWYRLWCRGHV